MSRPVKRRRRTNCFATRCTHVQMTSFRRRSSGDVHAFRTKAFDASLIDALRAGARQVVVLRAGFASRAIASSSSFAAAFHRSGLATDTGIQKAARPRDSRDDSLECALRANGLHEKKSSWRSFRRKATPKGIRSMCRARPPRLTTCWQRIHRVREHPR